MKHCDEFSQFINLFQERLKKLPDKRKGKNKQYEMRDAGLSQGNRILFVAKNTEKKIKM